MSAAQVNQCEVVGRQDQLGVVTRDMLIAENDIGVAFSADERLVMSQRKDLFFATGRKPVQAWRRHAVHDSSF
jgi:hypothetical protein